MQTPRCARAGIIPPSQVELIRGFNKAKEEGEAKRLRRSLADPLLALSASDDGSDGGIERVATINDNAQSDMEALTFLMGAILKGGGLGLDQGDLAALTRKSLDLADALKQARRKKKKEEEDVKKKTRKNRRSNDEENEGEKLGVEFCVATGIDVPDDDLRRLGLFEIEMNARKERKEHLKRKARDGGGKKIK